MNIVNLKDIISVIDNQPALDSLHGLSPQVLASAVKGGMLRVPVLMIRDKTRIALYQCNGSHYLHVMNDTKQILCTIPTSSSDRFSVSTKCGSAKRSLFFRHYAIPSLDFPFMRLEAVPWIDEYFVDEALINVVCPVVFSMHSETVFEGAYRADVDDTIDEVKVHFTLNFSSSEIWINCKQSRPILLGMKEIYGNLNVSIYFNDCLTMRFCGNFNRKGTKQLGKVVNDFNSSPTLA